MGSSPQKSNSISIRIQRNIASKLSKPSIVKQVLPSSYCEMLDVLYAVLCKYYPHQVAEKVSLVYLYMFSLPFLLSI